MTLPPALTRTVEVTLTAAFWRHVRLFPGPALPWPPLHGRPSRGQPFPRGNECVLLDSARVDDRLGRWSFLAGEPVAVLRGWRWRSGDGVPDGRGDADGGVPASWTVPGLPAGWAGPGVPARLELEVRRTETGDVLGEPLMESTVGDPLAVLRELARRYRPGQPACEAPLGTGLLGYLGYELGHCLEHLPEREAVDSGAAAGQRPFDPAPPDLAFLVCDEVLAHEHASGRTWLTVTGRGREPEADASRRIERWRRRLAEGVPEMLPATDRPARSTAAPTLVPGIADADYLRAVEQCRQHILAGDAFEICLTRQLTAPWAGSAWDLYEHLRKINPAPFAAWLNLGDVQVVSASPERFLRLDRDGRVESRPIKGTRPRGATAAEDDALRRDLVDSAKDRAENVMIVDLLRNDLGRVCRTGSVTVPELLVTEAHATVWQLVSTITGELASGHDAVDLVRACFPGGSMTGAPKIAAMSLLKALEPTPRGIYSGAIGYLDHGGAMDLNIVIRTLICAGGRVGFGVGGAVTADSVAEAELAETRDKAWALMEALGRAWPE